MAALLADPTRAGMLALLRDGPLCVCEMAAALDERQNNVSQPPGPTARRGPRPREPAYGVDARWIYYERDDAACAAAAAALDALLR